MFGDKRLDAHNQSDTNGTRVIIRPCNGQANQRWTFHGDGSIRNAHAGLCLDVNQGDTGNGSSLIPWTCDGQNNQKWTRFAA